MSDSQAVNTTTSHIGFRYVRPVATICSRASPASCSAQPLQEVVPDSQ
jgi:hypothetical protein